MTCDVAWLLWIAVMVLLDLAMPVTVKVQHSSSATPLVVYSNLTLSVARYDLAAASVSNLALFAGGSVHAAGDAMSNTVDIFNSITGVWTTATLNFARSRAAATSVANLALFGGGFQSYDLAVLDTVEIFNSITGNWTTAVLSAARAVLAATSVSSFALFAGGKGSGQGRCGESFSRVCNAVDIFNSNSGLWTTAILSVPRQALAATSVSNLAIFAGGVDWDGNGYNTVDIFNSTSGVWTTAILSVARWYLAATSTRDLALFGGGSNTDAVDIFNSTSGVWTTAILSVARWWPAATSIRDLALFGGGGQGNYGPYIDIVDVFNSTSGLWSTVQLSAGRFLLSATSVSNIALFGGGLSFVGDSRAVDALLAGCLSGFFINVTGICEPCPAGFYCPPASSSPPIPCDPGCFCLGRSGDSTPCPAGTHNPVSGGSSVSDCRACSPGSFNPGGSPALVCTLCDAGYFNPNFHSNSSSSCIPCALGTYNPVGGAGSSLDCVPCPAGQYGDHTALTTCKSCEQGTSNPSNGSSSVTACVSCAAGTYSNVSGSSTCTPCSAGAYNPANGSSSSTDCHLCPRGTSSNKIGASLCLPCPPATFAPELGSTMCGPCLAGLYCPENSDSGVPCPAGSSCPVGRETPCACKVFEYQPKTGMSACQLCPLAVVLKFNATTCQSQAPASSFLSFFYSTLVVMFSCIAIAAAVLTVRLARSRRTSILTVHRGTCVYVFMFVPYAALQAATIGQLATLNSQSSSSLARAAAQTSSSAAFSAFFALGFSGKAALVQMWSHIVRLHTNSRVDVPLRMQNSLRFTYRSFVGAVVGTIVFYVTGFAVLTFMFISSSNQCALQQSLDCVSSLQALQQPCLESLSWASILQYYEGIWAGFVLIVFTLLTLLFNGVVFAMLTEEKALSRLQLMIVHSQFLRWLSRPLLPKGWTASTFKTSGEVDKQRLELETLGTRLALISILSFLCKSALVATSYLAVDEIAASAQLESVLFLVSTLTVQAIPSALTLLLLSRFFFIRGGSRSDTLMQSLLPHQNPPVETASSSLALAAKGVQLVSEPEVEILSLQAEVQRLRLKMEHADSLQEEIAQQKAQILKLQHDKQTLQQENLRSREQIAQLRHQLQQHQQRD